MFSEPVRAICWLSTTLTVRRQTLSASVPLPSSQRRGHVDIQAFAAAGAMRVAPAGMSTA